MRIARILRSALLLATLPAAARAADVTVPIHLDHEFIRNLLVHEVFTEPGGVARVSKDTGCSFLELSSPRLESVGVRVRMLANGEGKLGKKIGGYCLTAGEWKGTVEVLEEVRVESDVPIVHFRLTEATIHGSYANRQATETFTTWIEQFLGPKLERITVDLRPAVAEVRELLPAVFQREEPVVAEHAVDSFRVLDAEADPTGLVARIQFELPDRPAPAAAPAAPPEHAADGTPSGASEEESGAGAPSEPPLTPEELARWNAAWQRWDAFLTYVAKHVAQDAASRELRDALLGVLLESRQDVLELLVPLRDDDVDPLRTLFVRTWERLAPVLREISSTVPGTDALRYATFLSAGDALEAIHAVGPQIGLDISSDGLRRMARMLTPQLADDPLAYGEQVDPDLRRIFGFGRPLTLPEERVAAAPPEAAGDSVPESEADTAASEAQRLARLDGWMPTRDELDEYLPLVRELLANAADRASVDGELDPSLHDAFRWMVLATAWQESCWRQWTQGRDGELKPLRSRSGAVGLMQVLERAWRGFYDLRALRNDIDYNARSGVDILRRYLVDHAAPGPAGARGDLDLLARTTYAIYHAGPKGGANRVDNPRTPRRLKKIDSQFWRRYQDVKAGHEDRVGECWGGS